VNNPFWWTADDKFFQTMRWRTGWEWRFPRRLFCPHKQASRGTDGSVDAEFDFSAELAGVV